MKLKLLAVAACLACTLPAFSQTPPASADDSSPSLQQGEGMLKLSALFSGANKPIQSGLAWRVLLDKGDGTPAQIVARSTQANPAFALAPGNYVIHAAYGFASGTKRVTLNAGATLNERLSVNAGAMKLAGSIADNPIPVSRVNFSIYVPLQGNSEGRLVVANAKAGDIIRLPEGTYHVVSTYGDSNAIQRSDIKVESGKLTEATLHHRAARVTLKLVAQNGGEAFAGTAFSVLTPGGDVIREAIGAFPEMILAEGDYVLIARQEGQIFTREFKVETGLDRDIEVLAQATAQPQPSARR